MAKVTSRLSFHAYCRSGSVGKVSVTAIKDLGIPPKLRQKSSSAQLLTTARRCLIVAAVETCVTPVPSQEHFPAAQDLITKCNGEAQRHVLRVENPKDANRVSQLLMAKAKKDVRRLFACDVKVLWLHMVHLLSLSGLEVTVI